MPPKSATKRKPEKQSSSSASKKRPKLEAKKEKKSKVDEDDDENNDDEDNDEDNEENDDENEDEGSENNDGDEDDDNESNDDDENDDDDDGDKKSKSKKVIKKSKKPVAKKSKSSSNKSTSKSSTKSRSSSNDDKAAKLKKLSKLERLEEARKAFKWWEAPDLPEGINWRNLEQSGMVFAAPYIPHGIPMKYDGRVINMTPTQEEMATFYAAIPEDGPQLGIEESRKTFQNNFFKEFVTLFDKSQNINDFDKCDFTLIKQHLDMQKNLRKAATNDEKEIKKLEKEKIQLKHAYAIIDGRLEKVIIIIIVKL